MSGTISEHGGPVKVGTLRASTEARIFRTFLLVTKAEQERIGRRIAQAREEAGLNQNQLAQRLGYADGRTIRYWESGQRTSFYKRLKDIAEITGKSPEWFTADDDGAPTGDRLARLEAMMGDIRERLDRLLGEHGE